MNPNNRRIAKNTLLLYFRMLLSMFVGLYTSRLVLQTLGVEDYGIYGVVGGVVSLFSFINVAMSGATSRFLNYEMGKEDSVRINETFCSSLIIHFLIAFIILFISETFGLWLLSEKLVISEGRMFAAHVVYQLSILNLMFVITQVPYNATIIAHERMDFFAYLGLIQDFSKLGIVYLLLVINYDKLIIYAVLSLIVAIIFRTISRLYCFQNFPESHFHWVWKPAILKPMITFTGWNTLSECGYSFRVYGSNLVLNMFFGTIVNAAGSIASTVQGILIGFINNITTAVRPQIIMSYSSNDFMRMRNLIHASIKINLFLVSLIVVPFLSETHYMLNLWLGSVPDYSVQFCRFLMLAIFITGISQIITIGIQATGDIRMTSISRNIFYIATPFFIYFWYRFVGSANPVYSYGIIVFIQAFVCLIDVYILSAKIPSIESFRICKDYFVSLVLVISLSVLASKYRAVYDEGFLRLLIGIFFQWTVIFLVFYYLILKSSDRELIHIILSRLLNKLLKNA